MFKLSRYICLFALLCGICISLGQLYAQEMDAIILEKEREFIAQMKAKKLPPEKFFEAYILAGEEFVRASEYKLAAYFFGQATKLEKIKDKLPAYYRQMAALLALPDFKLAGKLFPEVEKEFKQGKRSDDEHEKLLLYKVLVSQKLHDEVLNQEEVKIIKEGSRYLEGLKRHDIKIYLARENYAEIMKIYSGEGMQDVNIDEKIILDLATTLKDKKNAKNELLCQNQYEQFPLSHDSSYTMAICNMLIKVRSNKKPTKSDFHKAEEIISKKFPHSAYLIPVIKRML